MCADGSNYIEPIKIEEIEQLKAVLEISADISIFLNGKGDVLSIVQGPSMSDLGSLNHWLDQNIRDFLTEESITKLEGQLAIFNGEASEKPMSDRVELNHSEKNWDNIPVRYSFRPLQHKDGLVMVGRDMRSIHQAQQRLIAAQKSWETETRRTRSVAKRFRTALDNTSEAFAFVDPSSGQIQDLSNAAAKILGGKPADFSGKTLASALGLPRPKVFLTELGRAAASGQPIETETNSGSATLKISVTGSTGPSRDGFLLCRLGQTATAAPLQNGALTSALDIFSHTTDAIVFSDASGKVVNFNAGFEALIETVDPEAIKGMSLEAFFSRGTVDLKLILDALNDSSTLRSYATEVETEFGSRIPVDISVCRLGEGDNSNIGIILREVAPEVSSDAENPTASAEKYRDLLGHSSLKDIVRGATDVIERICLEAALEMTKNNRLAAAEMLGLSRQSFYVKLRKFDLL